MEKTEGKRLSLHAITLCALFAALCAVGAFIKIPVPVIPFTLQTMFVAMAGMILGPRLGAVSVGVYLLVGLVGIPVFTQGGGPAYVLQPTFGYLLGFVLAAWITGQVVGKVANPSYLRLVGGSLAGLIAVYGVGVPYYYCIANLYLGRGMSAGTVLLYCCLMTLPGDIFTILLGALVSKRVLPVARRALQGRAASAA